jgi:hypothetical protein
MSAPTVFYWDGVDHEDLYCVCGTPHPTVVSAESRRCETCGAIADWSEERLEWVIRPVSAVAP